MLIALQLVEKTADMRTLRKYIRLRVQVELLGAWLFSRLRPVLLGSRHARGRSLGWRRRAWTTRLVALGLTAPAACIFQGLHASAFSGENGFTLCGRPLFLIVGNPSDVLSAAID